MENSLGEFIYPQSVGERSNADTENLREKLVKGKNHGAKRAISLHQRDQKEFSALCYMFYSQKFPLLFGEAPSV